MFFYSVAGVGLSSDTPLDGLAEASAFGPHIHLTLNARRASQGPSSAITWCQRFTGRDGTPDLVACGRSDEGFVIRRRGVADYLVSAGLDEVSANPHEGTPQETIAEEFVGTALPFVLVLRGHLGLHASAVAIDGHAVAFTGISGSGKSTLASFLDRRGWPLLADDYLHLDQDGDRVVATSVVARARPRRDTIEALRRLLPAEPSGVRTLETGRCPLERVYVLSARDGASTGSACIERLSAGEASIALLSQMHRFDPSDRAWVTRQLDLCAVLAERHAVRRLCVPTYDALGDVPSLIRQDVTASAAAITKAHGG